MKTSQMISYLQKILELHGDQEVTVVYECGGCQFEESIKDIACSSMTGVKLIPESFDE